MINVGILDGDQVIVSKCDTARNGEIVVALVDDSATVKRFYKENGHYRLQPENDELEPIGGFYGRVVSIKEDSLVIESASDRTKQKIARWAVQQNLTIHDN